MPSEQEHNRQANHNEQVFQRLDSINIIDWAITVMFYTALHKVDAYLSRLSIHPRKHTSGDPTSLGRNDYISQMFPLNESMQYQRLYNASINSRYELYCLDPGSRAYFQTLLQNDFNPLNQYLNRILP